MAITIVNNAAVPATASAAGSTGITITKPANLADGDVLYAFISRTDFASTAAYSNSQGFSALTPTGGVIGTATGNDRCLSILRKVITNAAGEPANYTFVTVSGTTHQMVGIILPLRGVDTTTPEDISVPAYGLNTNTPNPASLDATSATADALVIAVLQEGLLTAAAVTPVAPSTYTLVPSGNATETTGSLDNQTILAYKTLGAAGSTAGTNAWQNTGTTGSVETLTAVVLVRAAATNAPATAATAAGASNNATVTVPFTDPTSYSGLQGWWDASQESFANNDAVGTFTDRSGNSRNLTQATGANQPLFKTAQFPSGGPGVDFDGSNDFMTNATALSSFISAGAYTLFFVVQVDAVATNAANTYDNVTLWGDSGGFAGVHLKSAGPTIMAYNWDGSDDHNDLTFATTTSYVYMQRHEGGNLYSALDGATETSVASGNTSTLTGTQFVGGVSGLEPFNGRIGEFFIYNVALTAPQMAEVTTYLTDKWLASSTNADAAVASSAGTANAATETVAPSSGSGSGVGAADTTTSTVASTVGDAASTGTANNATASVSAATSVLVTLNVNDSTLAYATDPDVAAGELVFDYISGAVTLAIAGGAAAAATNASAAVAAGVGAANDTTSAVAPSVTGGAGVGAGNAATGTLQVTAGAPAGTATANDATVSTSGAPAGAATGAGTANAATTTVATPSGAGFSTGTANNATVSTASATNAPAEAAASTGTANAATVTTSSATDATAATAAGTANNSTVAIAASPSTATVAGTASNVSGPDTQGVCAVATTGLLIYAADPAPTVGDMVFDFVSGTVVLAVESEDVTATSATAGVASVTVSVAAQTAVATAVTHAASTGTAETPGVGHTTLEATAAGTSETAQPAVAVNTDTPFAVSVGLDATSAVYASAQPANSTGTALAGSVLSDVTIDVHARTVTIYDHGHTVSGKLRK